MATKRTLRTRRTAYHEAGHAVMAIIQHRLFKPVTIIPNMEEKSWGEVELTVKYGELPRYAQTRKRFEGEILFFMAGKFATERLTGKSDIIETEQDFRAVNGLLICRYPEDLKTREECFRRLMAECAALVKDNWPMIEAVAEELLRVKTLSSKQARTIYRETLNPKKGI
jgi:ATP-dependent Zn protease